MNTVAHDTGEKFTHELCFDNQIMGCLFSWYGLSISDEDFTRIRWLGGGVELEPWSEWAL